MNKKGFTLIELLAVISLLSLLIIIMVSGVNNIFQSSKEILRNSKINTIVTSATNYANDHLNDYTNCENEEDNCYVSVEILIENNYIQPEYNGGISDPLDTSGVKFLNGKVLIEFNHKKLKAIGKEYIEE